MLIKTEGIVLKSMRYRESSIICDIMTRELGMRSYIVSGLYSKKSKASAALFHPLSILDLVVYDKENKDLNRIKEFKLNTVLQAIPYDIVKGTTALFIAEVMRNCLREKSPGSEIFDLLKTEVLSLEQSEPEQLSYFPLLFLLQLADVLGFGPQGQFTIETSCFDLRDGVYCLSPPLHQDYLDASESEALYHLIIRRNGINSPRLPRVMRKILLEKLIFYYRLHIDNFYNLRSVDILSKVLHE